MNKLHNLALIVWLTWASLENSGPCHVSAFVPTTRPFSTKALANAQSPILSSRRHTRTVRSVFIIVQDDDDEDEEEEIEEEEEEEEEEEVVEEDPYTQKAESEFLQDEQSSSSLTTGLTTSMDWGGALGKLRQRVDDVESGKSQNPSQALFRLMSSETPNQTIGKFVSSANPQVVSAMSGAVQSLLGGLMNPVMGVDTIVKASGERIGSLCFQLQMTGYMFRNAEYIVALKNLMNLRGSATVDDYREAFDRLDIDGSGFIETSEIQDLLDNVYDEKTPFYEVEAFMNFFDANQDGKISWDEFEKGLGDALSDDSANNNVALNLLMSQASDDDDDDDTPEIAEPEVSGTIEIELDNGKIVKVEAKEYIESLKEEAKALKEALRQEKLGGMNPPSSGPGPDFLPATSRSEEDSLGGVVNYIAARQGDLESLTKGISPEVVETMKMLVDFVLDGGESAKGKNAPDKAKMEMELPGFALQQLALWQLVIGYRLREAEATGEYLKLLE